MFVIFVCDVIKNGCYWKNVSVGSMQLGRQFHEIHHKQTNGINIPRNKLKLAKDGHKKWILIRDNAVIDNIG